MKTKTNIKSLLIGTLAASCGAFVGYFRDYILAWFKTDVGTSGVPMYVYLYPLVATSIAASCAIYAAHKAFSAAMLADIREREFRADELERKRLAYACSLFYELRRVLATCQTATGHTYDTIKTYIDENQFGVLKHFITDKVFVFVPKSMEEGWEGQSCLEKDTLRLLYKIRIDINELISTTQSMKNRCEIICSSLETTKKYPKDSIDKMYDWLEVAKKEAGELVDEIAKFRTHLIEIYNVKG
ncbi:MAG: hypothetical protein K0R10_71 [Alphaproteobacteria bacterium]|nr:hypothetical protein [Alphaproteobacteria bacterium]